jgi:ubiquinone biosynthesis protein UbiJ
MGFLSDAVTTLKNVVLMQSSIERLERVVERQNDDIAGLRDAMAAMNERIVRLETKFEIYERMAVQRRIES